MMSEPLATTTAADLARAYFEAFNRHDDEAMIALLDQEVAHDINEGGREVGVEAFRRFRAHMNRCYRERISDLRVMADGDRACAEFICSGEYIATDDGLPEAGGQRYAIPACAIFEARDGRIVRLTSYYNLRGWIAAVGG